MSSSAEVRQHEAASYPVEIFIAGDVNDAVRICREYCFEVGLCVTVTPTEYVYTAGAEAGVRIGLINYPRFPSEPAQLWGRAVALAELLISGPFQSSATVQASDRTLWLTRRPE